MWVLILMHVELYERNDDCRKTTEWVSRMNGAEETEIIADHR